MDVLACRLCVPLNRFLFVAGSPQTPDLAVTLGAAAPGALQLWHCQRGSALLALRPGWLNPPGAVDAGGLFGLFLMAAGYREPAGFGQVLVSCPVLGGCCHV